MDREKIKMSERKSEKGFLSLFCEKQFLEISLKEYYFSVGSRSLLVFFISYNKDNNKKGVRKLKKGILGLLTALLIITVFIVEFQTPAASADTYYIAVEKAGKPIHRNNFHGYLFKERCMNRNGERKTIEFLSSKSLERHKRYKVIIRANNLLVNAKPMSDKGGSAVQYLDEK